VTAVLADQRGSDYAGLSRQVRAARLLDRTPWRYGLRIAATVLFFLACWWALVAIGQSWLVLVPAVLLGVASTQVAFLGHDGGHQQIAATRTGNTVVGLLAGNLLTGLSIGWWIDKHVRHHANPNKEDHDPDIGEGVFAFTTTHAANRAGRLPRAIARNQALLFFPLLTLEGLNLHAASVRWLFRARGGRLRRTELLLLSVHVLAYLGVVLWVLSPVLAVAFVAVHQAVFGLYMGCSFAPNHKGMPIIGAEQKLDYLRRQVVTSRNVRGGWFVDQLLGGLNYQVEHHLFPSMPRTHLRKAQRLVQTYCAQHRIPYTETGLFASYACALRYLHTLGGPLRAAHLAASKA
jgi:fatty acid desaturase